MAYLLDYNNKNHIYIHIPKTGGMSIGADLKNHKTIKLIPKENINGHLSFNDINKRLGGKIWDYNMFTTIRNPWSWYVSWYFWVKNHPNLKSNTDFTQCRDIILNNDINHFIKWVRDNREVEFFVNNGMNTKKFQEFVSWIGDLDFVKIIKLEEIDDIDFTEKVGIPLKVTSKNNVSNNLHYSELYNDDSINIIGELHKNDIEIFGYEYEKR